MIHKTVYQLRRTVIVVRRHLLSCSVQTSCSPGGAESCFMLTGFLELYRGEMWSTDNPLLRSDENEKGYLG